MSPFTQPNITHNEARTRALNALSRRACAPRWNPPCDGNGIVGMFWGLLAMAIVVAPFALPAPHAYVVMAVIAGFCGLVAIIKR